MKAVGVVLVVVSLMVAGCSARARLDVGGPDPEPPQKAKLPFGSTSEPASERVSAWSMR